MLPKLSSRMALMNPLQNSSRVPIRYPEPLTFKVLSPHGDSTFRFIAEMVIDEISQLGFEGVELIEKVDHHDYDSMHLQFYSWEQSFSPGQKYIMYNWEQMRLYNFYNHIDMIQYFRSAHEIWDYSILNVEYLRKFGINALLLLPSYHQTMGSNYDESLQGKRQKKVFFWGKMGLERRQTKTKMLSQQYGDAFQLISEPADIMLPRVIINLHSAPVDESVLEIHRISQLIAHKVLCVTERSSDPILDSYMDGLVDFFDGDDWSPSINRILNMTEIEYQQEADRRLEQFKQKPSFGEQLRKSDSRIWRDQLLKD
ncbi:hypothetical protein HDU91_005491 [Kappamyces sp. JEL0680]|nr:hypothetical protein HDU91_005491 [Kappamyces sp. JEL0680]